MKEMVKVYLYNNGNISIEPTKSFSAIQKIYFKYPDIEGMCYICEKGQEEYYLNKMIEEREKEIQDKIEELKLTKACINNDLNPIDSIIDNVKEETINYTIKELEKIKGRIYYIRNSGMGKNKSIEYIEKYINGEISELKREESITEEERNEAIEFFKKIAEKEVNNAKYSKLAIEALEQEPILDKIRAEIEQIVDEEQKHDKKWAVGLRYSLKIIDKYLPTERKGENK